MARNIPYGKGGYYPDNYTGDSVENRVDLEKYSMSIEELEKEVTSKMEEDYRTKFERQAHYLGNKVYSIAGLYSSDTRQLFLMYCLLREDLKMDDFARKMESIRQRKLSNEASTSSFDPNTSF